MQKRIGIIGGGQLGRLIAIDAKKLGFIINVIDPTPNSPAGQVADHQIVADYNDEKAIKQLAKISDYLTFEIELANAKILDELSKKGLIINPSAKSLSIIKDKLTQKIFLKKVNIPVADFIEVKSTSQKEFNSNNNSQWDNSKINQIKIETTQIAKKFGYPLLLKARYDAYDGRGNALIRNENEIIKGIKKLTGRKLYIEKFVPFTKELAVMVGRNLNHDIISYPVVETIHKNNICNIVIAPAPVEKKIHIQAIKLAEKVMKLFEGAGIFGIEMFLLKNGDILINEIAPRVHNSGHYTLEATETSQFEQHVRAITGLPFASTKLKTPVAVMINILGNRNGKAKPKGIAIAKKIPGTSIHIYGKLQTKVDRKMGHITVIGNTLNETLNKAKKARKLITF